MVSTPNPKRRNIPRQHAEPISLVVQLDGMTHGGDALGHVDGKAIFVQGGIAGERVRVAVVEEHERFARARVIEVLDASPARVTPRCPHFGFDHTACGGCQWQHIDYAAQVRFKTEVVREQLRRIGRIDPAPVRETVASPEAWAYRNRVQFSVTPDGRLGFQAARSNHVVQIRECHIVQQPIADWLQAAGRKEVMRIDVRTANNDASPGVWAYDVQATDAQLATRVFQIKDVPFHVSGASFFQVNTSLIETLVDQVIERLAVRPGETVLDAYCGVGLFARFVAPVAGRVIGIESSPSAIADARENLKAFEHVVLREGLVEAVLERVTEGVDAAVVDPPRAGCGSKVIATLIDKQVRRLVYVSCDPATLARDARQLIDGGYRLVEVQPLDLFPQTYHIECVAQFEAATT